MQVAKCVVVGDSGTGKTYLLFTYIKRFFPGEYTPDFYDSYTTEVKVDNQTVGLSIWDSAGREEYDNLRPLCYHLADVVIVCFSISDPLSYENVTKKWLPEVKHNCPTAPLLLVGTKCDLRDNPDILEKLEENNQSTITQQQGMALASQIKAVKYLECALINQEGLDKVFEEAAHAFLYRQTATNKHCVLL